MELRTINLTPEEYARFQINAVIEFEDRVWQQIIELAQTDPNDQIIEVLNILKNEFSNAIKGLK